MKKIIYTASLVVISILFVHAQPKPDCAGTGAKKRLFVKSKENLLSDLVIMTASPSDIDSTINCFTIGNYKIKDSIGSIFFDLKIYKTIADFSDDHWHRKKVECMHIYIKGLNFTDSANKYFKDTFTYYIEIPKFLNGEYWIDVSKITNNLFSVPCGECIENHYSRGKYITAMNITPNKWRKKKKKRK